MLIYKHEHLYVKAFIVVLFTNKKFSRIGEWINKLWHLFKVAWYTRRRVESWEGRKKGLWLISHYPTSPS